jgi:hypothetical protein
LRYREDVKKKRGYDYGILIRTHPSKRGVRLFSLKSSPDERARVYEYRVTSRVVNKPEASKEQPGAELVRYAAGGSMGTSW